jgi:hypothetical protein
MNFKIEGPILQNNENRGTKTIIKPFIYELSFSPFSIFSIFAFTKVLRI